MQPAMQVLGTPKYQHATRGMPRLVGGVCMYIAKVGIHSFGVVFSVWLSVWCVVGLLALEGKCAVLVSCPVLWHGCTLGLLTSRAKYNPAHPKTVKKQQSHLRIPLANAPWGAAVAGGKLWGVSRIPQHQTTESTVSSPHGSPQSVEGRRSQTLLADTKS
jgi:hypothetical protein